MKVNFNKRFRDYNGVEIKGETIGMTVAKSLFNHGGAEAVDADTKFRAYLLSQKIAQAMGDVDITVEDAALIKEVCGKSLTAGGYGQVCGIIEQNNG